MLTSTITSSPFLVAASWALCAALACAAILWGLLKTGLAWQLATDVPNDRSLHTLPTPRAGAWGVVPVAGVGIWMADSEFHWIVALVAFLAIVSLVDDRRGLPARVRFSAHVAAVAVLLSLYPSVQPWWVFLVIAFVLVWLINLYNFMDGADGLAGGMTLFGFSAYAAGAVISAHPSPSLAIAAATVAGASLGFLIFNFHPARIFLGDAGSISLGFLAGAMGYWGWIRGVWPLWFPPLIFSPFIADASATLFKRLLRGEKFWQAHREHYYQRMVRSGLGHALTAVSWYFVMAIGAGVALWGLDRSPLIQWIVVAVWACILICVGGAIDVRWQRFLKLTTEKDEA
ncbi:MraY family glycosyltransferase [Burkholderia diffusa]|uniref:Glycosyl transferase n=1 Tax=Burkholderia diffusa TaxID=488732 RepID=A0A6P2LVE4_9BURK|nr:glycosyltransferase family 4 protein [Burkholderia diffusa]KAB0659442.1 glycosyltransferase family 4 protein [Burkholderia diffusa]MBM2651593.1 glycosyltransferase family 4 protein [Burkholderia diffusa]VWB70910.1 glycosyl transferase [Burkholderia diffusa]